MEFRNLGKTGVKVSELGLGCMTFGRESSEGESHKMIDRFREAGGNFIDTADVYSRGISEEIVGRWLKGKRREDFVLATKVRFPMGEGPNDVGLSRKHIMDGVEGSLKRLQTDYIDLYQVHCWDGQTPLEETMSALDDVIKAGKTRYIGVSNFTAWQIMKALSVGDLKGYARFVCLQPQYSLVVRDIEREILPLCREEGLGVIPWSPLGGGFLSGKYKKGEKPPEGTRIAGAGENNEEAWARRATEKNWKIIDTVGDIASKRGKTYAQISLAWLLAQRGVTAPILGVRTIEQLEDNLGSVGWVLTDEELKSLDEVSAFEEGYPYRFIKNAQRR